MRDSFHNHFVSTYLDTLAELLVDRRPGEVFKKALRLWRRDGFDGCRRAANEIFYNRHAYTHRIRNHERLNEEDRRLIGAEIESFPTKPLISVLMPVYNPRLKWLEAAVESVMGQLYPYWQLCIADDASVDPEVRVFLEKIQCSDERIQVYFRANNGHISEASNSALKMVRGEFVALLDHDDELSELALYMIASVLQEKPDLDLIYSDEDRISESGCRYSPYFKPDWSPDLLLGQNVVSHLGVYRSSRVREVGGFRVGYEGSQDWDLALRVAQNAAPDRIHHIPQVLYHWRAVPGSTAVGIDEKNYAVNAARRLLLDHCRRNGIEASIQQVVGGQFGVRYCLPAPLPMVSVIVASRGSAKVLQCLLENLFLQTHYENIEVVLVGEFSADLDKRRIIDSYSSDHSICVLDREVQFSMSKSINDAVENAVGELICLLDENIEPVDSSWLREMVGQALRPGVGAVGAMLYSADGKIEHAGFLLQPDDVAATPFFGYPKGYAGYGNRARLVQNLSAVSAACMVIKKRIWDHVGGFNHEQLPSVFSDVDLCLRLLQNGLRNVWTPFSELSVSTSRGSYVRGFSARGDAGKAAASYMVVTWGEYLKKDPAFNPNLELVASLPRVVKSPRMLKPWNHSDAGK